MLAAAGSLVLALLAGGFFAVIFSVIFRRDEDARRLGYGFIAGLTALFWLAAALGIAAARRF